MAQREAAGAFRTGTTFLIASLRLREPMSDPENKDRSYMLGEPLAVCAALAAELLLKSPILRKRGRRDEHRLHMLLYDAALPADERQIILDNYLKLRTVTESRMVKEIEESSKAFIDWRYVHEFQAGPEQTLYLDYGVLTTLARAAYLTALQLEPHWQLSSYLHDRIMAPEDSQFFLAVVDDLSKAHAFTQQSLAKAKIATGKPQPDVIEGENHRFRLTTPTLNLKNETATLNVKIGGSPNSTDDGSGKPVEYGRIFPLPVIAR